MNFLSLPLATGFDVGLIYGLAGMTFAALFGLFGMYFHHRRRLMWHETARIALEKGLPVPEASPDRMPWSGQSWRAGGPEATGFPAEDSSRSCDHRRRGLMIGGLINIAVGAGLFIALSQVSKPTAYFAAIPGFIGVALLLGALIETLLSRNSNR